MGFESFVRPMHLQTGHRPESILRERFIYEERREILKWRRKRTNRLAEIEADLTYEYTGEFVVARPRKPKKNRFTVYLRGPDLHVRAKTKKKWSYSKPTRYSSRRTRTQLDDPFAQNPGVTKVGNRLVMNEERQHFNSRRMVPFLVNLNEDEKEKPEVEGEERMSKKARKRLKRKREEEGDTPEITFLGLYSGITYNSKADVLDSLRPVMNYFGDPNKNLSEEILEKIDEYERGIHDLRLGYTGNQLRQGMGIAEPELVKSWAGNTKKRNGYLRDWDIVRSGLERLPVKAQVATVTRESDRIRLMTSGLSQQTQRLLNRNIDPETGVSVRYKYHTEYDHMLGERGRSTRKDTGVSKRIGNLLSFIVITSMANNERSILSYAYTLLLRMPQTSIQVMWTVGLELLAWKREDREQSFNQESQSQDLSQNAFSQSQFGRASQSTGAARARVEEERFLEWLIVLFPYNKNITHSVWKDRDRAEHFHPQLILSKLRLNNPRAAIEKIEELILEAPYTDNPIYYFYMGIAYIQLARDVQPRHQDPTAALKNTSYDNEIIGDFEKCEQYIRKSRNAFDTCHTKGGVYPENLINFELDSLETYVENGVIDDAQFVKAPPVEVRNRRFLRRKLAVNSKSTPTDDTVLLKVKPIDSFYTVFDELSTLY